MLYILWIIVFSITVLYTIQNPRMNKGKKMIMGLLFIFLWILLGWSRGAYDVEIGVSRYVNYQYFQSFTEIGYNFLVVLAHRWNMGYRTFFAICSFVELLAIFWFVNKNCKKTPIVMGLFILYPSIIYLQYIRNLAAIPFILIAIDSLINKRKWYYIKYIIFILLAATIHFSSLFFLIYLPISFIKEKRIVFMVTIILFVILQVSSRISFIYNLVTQYIGSEKTDILIRSTNSTGNFGRVFGMIFSIMTFFCLYMILKRIYKVKMDDSDLFFNINLMSFLCIPLMLNYGVGFGRIPTLLYIINYCFLVNKISCITSQKKRLQVYLILGMFLLALLFMNFRNLEYRKLVLYPFFEQNELIQWLLR